MKERSTRSGVMRRRSGLVTGALLVAILAASASQAQQNAWKPEKPVELVVPTTAGGAIDTTARLMQKVAQNGKLVTTPIVILNKPGGGQTVAMTYLDQRAGDGHTVLVSTMSVMTNHILGRSPVNYTDYTALPMLYGEPMTIVVKTDSPLKSGRDIQERLKKDPQSLTIGVGIAVGGTNHLAVALVLAEMGVDTRKLKTVVFQANAEAQTALMGGHVDIAPMSTAAALNAQRQGRLRIVGISSEKRGEGELAEIPTWKEQGFDVVFTNSRFLLGPKGLTPAQTGYWDAVTAQLVQNDEWKKEVQRNYWEPDFVPSKEMPQRLAALYKQLQAGLVEAGLIKK
jgi:putative tricarboxylic transport membrane protein